MTAFFTTSEGSILVKLLIAHCLTDFVLQPNKWVSHKRLRGWRSKYLWYHTALTIAVAILILSDYNWLGSILFIGLTHFFIDGLKIAAEKKLSAKTNAGFYLFTADQLMHIIVIVMVWLFKIDGWQHFYLAFTTVLNTYVIALKLLGYLIVMGPVGYFIHYLTRRWVSELNAHDSLADAGKWIGILERVLVLTLVYINQFAGIGFLIAAKSVLRVTDRPGRPVAEPTLEKPFSSRKHTEYVLIGTFLSFSIAIVTGLIINSLIAM